MQHNKFNHLATKWNDNSNDLGLPSAACLLSGRKDGFIIDLKSHFKKVNDTPVYHRLSPRSAYEIANAVLVSRIKTYICLLGDSMSAGGKKIAEVAKNSNCEY
jgi:hypothetical protein